jgi:ABC-type Fe3+ transport system permease subunit
MIDKLLAAGPWLLLLVQGTACLAVGLAVSHAWRHRPARAHQVLVTALLASVLMPGLYLSAGYFELGVLAPDTAPLWSRLVVAAPPSPEVEDSGWTAFSS